MTQYSTNVCILGSIINSEPKRSSVSHHMWSLCKILSIAYSGKGCRVECSSQIRSEIDPESKPKYSIHDCAK